MVNPGAFGVLGLVGMAQVGEQEFSKSFGSVLVAALGRDGVKGFGQIVVQRHGQSFQGGLLVKHSQCALVKSGHPFALWTCETTARTAAGALSPLAGGP